MKKHVLLFSAYLVCAVSAAHAGFFDSLSDAVRGVTEQNQNDGTSPTASHAESSKTDTQGQTGLDTALGLIPMLTSQLSVSDEQAKGGMGSLLNLAKNNLASGEFEQLSSGIPDMDAMLAAMPVLGSSNKASGYGGLLSNATGLASSLGGISQLQQQFESLGLKPEMIGQFADLAMQYLSQQGQAPLADLLKQGLGAALS